MGIAAVPSTRPASSVRPPDRLLFGWWNHCQADTDSALHPSLCGERAGRAVGLDRGPWWNPEVVSQWQKTLGGIVSISVGGFMLIWETVYADTASPLLVGAGLLALGVPVTLPIDAMLRRRAGED